MAVTCVRVRNCKAVGGLPGIERWDGTKWSQMRNPDRQLGTLYGVACSSGSSCMAVGNSYVPMGGGATLAEHWNGRAWSISRSVSPSMGQNTLSAVSCPAPSNCTAVGYDTGYQLEGSQLLVYNQAMVEQWDGHSWSPEILTAGETNNNSLSGVSCFDATDCIAVGSTGSGGLPLIEQWEGTTWSMVAPDPTATGALSAISCSGATDCTAVGIGSDNVALIEHWDGSSWSVVANPDPPGSTSSALNAVSCTSPSNCTAVGSDTTGSGQFTLVEAWDGSSWSIVPSPSP